MSASSLTAGNKDKFKISSSWQPSQDTKSQARKVNPTQGHSILTKDVGCPESGAGSLLGGVRGRTGRRKQVRVTSPRSSQPAKVAYNSFVCFLFAVTMNVSGVYVNNVTL